MTGTPCWARASSGRPDTTAAVPARNAKKSRRLMPPPEPRHSRTRGPEAYHHRVTVVSGSGHLGELARADVELEQLDRVAAEDVALGLLFQERQVVDRRRQVEVPVRIVGRIEQLALRLDALERRLEEAHVARNFHRLRRVEHVGDVLAGELLQPRAFGRA